MRQGDCVRVRGSPNDRKTQPANDTVNMGSGNNEKRKRECDPHGHQHSTRYRHKIQQAIQGNEHAHTHETKKANRKRGEPRTRTLVRARGSRNEKKN